MIAAPAGGVNGPNGPVAERVAVTGTGSPGADGLGVLTRSMAVV
jgi:hypothetical protein